MEVIVLTGMSGAGKSKATQILEDLSYYCISNLPFEMIPTFTDRYLTAGDPSQKLAFVIDARGEINADTFLNYRKELEEKGCTVRVIFLDCTDAVLVNRYKETRRVHPMAALYSLTVSRAIAKERQILAPFCACADYVIDTTSLAPAQLGSRLLTILGLSEKDQIVVNCVSFGFKYGAVNDADLVFDVRCFPNPFWVADLAERTGLDEEVKAYLFSHDVVLTFLQKLYDMIDYLLPLYVEEGKNQLTVAIGCTGGKHRSVAFAEALKEHLCQKDIKAMTQHRDIVKKFVGDR